MQRNNRNQDFQYDQPMPHDIGTEQAVLATLMRYNEQFNKYGDLLGVELFYYPNERAVYKCIAGVIGGGGITDINSLYEYAQRHEVGDLLEKIDFISLNQYISLATLEQDIRRLRDMAQRRITWEVLMRSAQKVLDVTTTLDNDVNEALTSISEVQQYISEDGVETFDKALQDVDAIVEGNKSGITQALMTGFKLFDEKYILRPQTLTVVAAFPAVGKSALALNIAEAVARKGNAVAYYSLEMSKSELASRAISEAMNTPAYVIMNKPLNDTQVQSLREVIGRFKDLPIYFDDRSTVSFDRVIRSIRKLAKSKGIKLAIIDYLQIFNQSAADDEERGMSYMARQCKNIAKETGVAVIALSQLNRSELHPSLRNLRGSGQIEESADNVVLIDRPEAYPDNKVTKYQGDFKDASIHNTAKLILAKGRGVGTGSTLVAFNGRHTRFAEIDRREEYKEHNEDLPF